MFRVFFSAAVMWCVWPFAAAQGAGPGMPEGPYAGVTLGIATSNFVDQVYDWYGGSAGGFVAGGQIGYNVDWGPAIVGIEADANWNSARAVSLWDSTYYLDWDASIRGRLGFDAGQFTPYVTAGIATGGARNVYGSDVWGHTPIGWTVGIGAETAINDRLTGRLEFRHLDLGERSYGYDIKPTKDSLQFGLNYRLSH